MTGDFADLRQALISCWQSLLLDLLGQPTQKGPREWRWGSHGSLSAVVAGRKAGAWFDHEAGTGGGPIELIVRERGGDWCSAADWARTWLSTESWTPDRPASAKPRAANDTGGDPESAARQRAQRLAQERWQRAEPASVDHAYLRRKNVGTHGVRQDYTGKLVIPLVDLAGTIHTTQTIDPKGDKLFLKGGAKAEHFAIVGGALAGATTILLCEGWATAANAHEATGLPVAAAMDAGNVCRVAPLLRIGFPEATLIILADNDVKPGKAENPGVAAATAAAGATGALLAIPPQPGDMNDLAASCGLAAVAACIAAARPAPSTQPTYQPATLAPAAARLVLDGFITQFMADVASYWSRPAAEHGGAEGVTPDSRAMAGGSAAGLECF